MRAPLWIQWLVYACYIQFSRYSLEQGYNILLKVVRPMKIAHLSDEYSRVKERVKVLESVSLCV